MIVCSVYVLSSSTLSHANVKIEECTCIAGNGKCCLLKAVTTTIYYDLSKDRFDSVLILAELWFTESVNNCTRKSVFAGFEELLHLCITKSFAREFPTLPTFEKRFHSTSLN